LGLNIDNKSFNPINTCSEGGLYFFLRDESKCHLYFNQYGVKIANIEISNDAQIYIEEDKFKADKLIISEIIHFNDANDDFWINMIKNNGPSLCLTKGREH